MSGKYNHGELRISIAGDPNVQNRPAAIEVGGTSLQENLTNKLELVGAPSSSSSTGKKGQIAIDDYFLYVCVDDDSWKCIQLTEIIYISISDPTHDEEEQEPESGEGGGGKTIGGGGINIGGGKK